MDFEKQCIPKKIEKNNLKAYLRRELLNLEDGTVIDFMKVRHTREILSKHASEIQKFISEADILISELVVFEDDENQSEIQSFYSGVTKLAKENKKKDNSC